ncbi:hypothetical protein ACIBJE_27155 [Micromonospora sp. NPDC050187]|uniref:hypothetical protein n=1 Tax=Micromonospora sp. NPDC050187 TaxID=3364277 RepID=UPI0037B83501
MGRRSARDGWRAAAFLLGGLLVTVLGGTVLAAGTGAFGLRTETFTRIECHSVRVEKGGRIWHCRGQSPAQVAASAEMDRRATLAWLAAHPDERPALGQGRQVTRLLFVDHDGRTDPERVTATHLPVLGDRWIAHSGSVRATGTLLTLLGVGLLANGVRLVVRPGRVRTGTGGGRPAGWS